LFGQSETQRERQRQREDHVSRIEISPGLYCLERERERERERPSWFNANVPTTNMLSLYVQRETNRERRTF